MEKDVVKTYYFCAKVCKAKFDSNPAQYVK